MYVYNADTYCDSCGEKIAEELRAQGVEDDGDSDTFPQSAIEEETDGPDHCASQGDCLEGISLTAYGLRIGDSLHGAETSIVGAILSDGLTEYGETYLREMLRDDDPTPYQAALHRLWRETFNVEEEDEEDDDSYLGSWENSGGAMTLKLWDTYRTDHHGKSKLRYRLTINGVKFEGEDFCPSPMIAIDSDESAGALVGFFAHYGESLRYSGDDAECAEEFTAEQREVLADEYDELSMWSVMLEEEGDEEEQDTPQEDDDKIGDVSGGYSVSHGGKYLGTFERFNRAAAALYIARAKSGYYPNIWQINDHGNVSMMVFHGHVLKEDGPSYV